MIFPKQFFQNLHIELPIIVDRLNTYDSSGKSRHDESYHLVTYILISPLYL